MAADAVASPPRVASPTIVIGLGDAGRRVAQALRSEASGADPNLRCLAWISSDAPDDLRRATEEAFQSLLTLQNAVDSRVAGTIHELPVDIFIVARLGADNTSGPQSETPFQDSDPPLASADFTAALGALDQAYRRYVGVLGRDRPRARLFASPVLLLPDMDEHQPEIVALIAGLAPRFTDHPELPPRLPLARCYLIEPHAGHYLLDDATRLLMARSYLRFLLYGSLRTEGGWFRGAYEPHDDPDPFASFIVGCAELPGGLVADLAAAEAGLMAMRALEEPSGEPVEAELAAFHERAWLDQLLERVPSDVARTKAAGEIKRRTSGLVQAVDPTKLLERPRRVRERVGSAWARDREQAFRAATGGDGLADATLAALVNDMAREGRHGAGANAEALNGRLAAWLEADNGFHHLDADAFLEAVEGAVATRRDEAAEKASAAVDPGPPPDRIAGAVSAVHDEVDRKPDPLLILLAGTLLTVLMVFVGSGIIPVLAGVFERPGQARPAWLALLREAPSYHAVGATLAALGVGCFFAYRLWAQTRAINRQLGDETRAPDSLEATLSAMATGPRRSVKAWFETRHDSARAHWHARVLSDLGRRVGAARTRLLHASVAVHIHRGRLEREHASLVDRLAKVPTESPVLRSIVEGDALRRLALEAATRAVGTEPVRAVKRILAPYRPSDEAVPFASLDLLTAAARHAAARHSVTDVLVDADLCRFAAQQIWRVVDEIDGLRRLGGIAAVGAQLRLPLQLSELDADPMGISGPKTPTLFATAETLTRLSEDVGPDADPKDARTVRRRELLASAKQFYDPDRVYLLQVVWGINARSIPWLRDAWPTMAPTATSEERP